MFRAGRITTVESVVSVDIRQSIVMETKDLSLSWKNQSTVEKRRRPSF